MSSYFQVRFDRPSQGRRRAYSGTKSKETPPPPPPACKLQRRMIGTLIAGLITAAAGFALVPRVVSLAKPCSTRFGVEPAKPTAHWLFAGSGSSYFLTAGLAIFGCVASRCGTLLSGGPCGMTRVAVLSA